MLIPFVFVLFIFLLFLFLFCCSFFQLGRVFRFISHWWIRCGSLALSSLVIECEVEITFVGGTRSVRALAFATPLAAVAVTMLLREFNSPGINARTRISHRLWRIALLFWSRWCFELAWLLCTQTFASSSSSSSFYVFSSYPLFSRLI